MKNGNNISKKKKNKLVSILFELSPFFRIELGTIDFYRLITTKSVNYRF